MGRRIILPVTRREPVPLSDIEALYRARLGAFRRVARAILGDPDAARDAVQEAFASVVRSRGSFRGEGSFEGWVWRTVVNAARMQRRATRPAVPLDEETAANGHAHPDPQLRAAVAALPERQRLVLFLRYYADLDYAAIAETLEISPGTVAATLNSARSSLRSVLEEVPR
jgi:RNA polymerase sigma factor (sigma-70 family)